MSETEVARKDRMEALVVMLKNQLDALEHAEVTTLGIGGGEVSVALEMNDMPPEVKAGIRRMLQDKLAKLESELR